MKTIKIEITVWERGDYVVTPAGVGTIAKDEVIGNNYSMMDFDDVIVQHKEGTSENTSNEPVAMKRWIPTVIPKQYYEQS